MARLNVYLPDELATTVNERLPDLNVSKVIQDALRALLSCRHEQLVCGACNSAVDQLALARQAKREFATQLLWELEDLIAHGGTAEGAGRIFVSVAKAHQIEGYWHAPRPNRTQQRRNADRRWLEEQAIRLAAEAAS